MSYTVTLTETAKNIDASTTIQAIIVITVDATAANESYTFAEKNLVIEDHGQGRVSVDIEDNGLVVASHDILIYDEDEYLKGLLFDNDIDFEESTLEIKLNGTSDFKGNIISSDVEFVGPERLRIKAAPQQNKLHETAMFADDVPQDPFGYTSGTTSYTVSAITKLSSFTMQITVLTQVTDFSNDDYVKLANIGGMTDVNGVWKVSNLSAPVGGPSTFNILCSTNETYTGGGTARRCADDDDIYYFHTAFLQEFFMLVNSSISYGAGQIDIVHSWDLQDSSPASLGDFADAKLLAKDWVFATIEELYNDTQTAADMLKKWAFEWGAYAGMLSIERGVFVQLYYYDSSDLQTVTVLSYLPGFKYQPIQYVNINGIRSAYAVRSFAPSIAARNAIDSLSIVKDNANTLIARYGGTTHTNVKVGSTEVAFVNDDNIAGGANTDSVNLCAAYYYYWRNQNQRVDKFVLKGVSYDFVQNFTYDSGKYRIIDMRKRYRDNQTDIEAIYLGSI